MPDIFQIFRENSNPDQAIKMSAYMKNLFPFLGIPKPKRAELSKTFLKESKKHTEINWAFIDKCWSLEREFQYLALEYLRIVSKLLTIYDIPKLKDLATTKSWWDSVDSLDLMIGNIALENPEVNDIMLEWSVDDNFWLRRLAIDHQLLRKEKTNTKLLEKILINNLGQKEFFINKAIGWSLREYSKTNPKWVRNFVETHKEKMAPLSIREASKYI